MNMLVLLSNIPALSLTSLLRTVTYSYFSFSAIALARHTFLNYYMTIPFCTELDQYEVQRETVESAEPHYISTSAALLLSHFSRYICSTNIRATSALCCLPRPRLNDY
jgi:hypothetical protein